MARCRADHDERDKYGATGPYEINPQDPATWNDAGIIRDIGRWRQRNGDPAGAKSAFALARRISKNEKP